MFAKENPFADYKKHLEEKALSKAQQRLMGQALAYKRGDLDDASDEVKKLANSMSEKDLEDFAKTKHKGLPDRIGENASAQEEDNPCWDGYKKVPGKKDYEKGSCVKEEIELDEAIRDDTPLTKKTADGKHQMIHNDKSAMRAIRKGMSDHEKKHFGGAYRDDTDVVHKATGKTMTSLHGKTVGQARKEIQAYIAKHHPEPEKKAPAGDGSVERVSSTRSIYTVKDEAGVQRIKDKYKKATDGKYTVRPMKRRDGFKVYVDKKVTGAVKEASELDEAAKMSAKSQEWYDKGYAMGKNPSTYKNPPFGIGGAAMDAFRKGRKAGEAAVKKEENELEEAKEVHIRLDYLDGDKRQKQITALLQKFEDEGTIEFSGETDKGALFNLKKPANLGSMNKELQKVFSGAMFEEVELQEADTYAIYKKGKVFDTFRSKEDAQDSLDSMDLSSISKKDYSVRKLPANYKADWSMKEEDESLSLVELSSKALTNYISKASDARGHRNLSTKKLDKRYSGVAKASRKLAKRDEESEVEEAKKHTIKKLDKDTLEMLRSLDDEEARLIIQGLPSSIRKVAMKELGLKEKVDGRTTAYKETASRLLKMKEESELDEADLVWESLDELEEAQWGADNPYKKYKNDPQRLKRMLKKNQDAESNVRNRIRKFMGSAPSGLKDELKDIEKQISQIKDVMRKEVELEEKRAFIFAAAIAKSHGKNTFEFNGKEYKVTMKKGPVVEADPPEENEEEVVQESTKEYAKSLQQLADKAKKDKISSNDLLTLSKLAQLMKKANEELEENNILQEANFKKAAIALEKLINDPKFKRFYRDDIGDLEYQIYLLKDGDYKNSGRSVRNLDTIIRDIVSDAVHRNSSAADSKVWHDAAGLQRIKENVQEAKVKVSVGDLVTLKPNKSVLDRTLIGKAGVVTGMLDGDAMVKFANGRTIAISPRYLTINEEIEEKKGLWANIHAKRKRGERPAKPGEKGYPKTLDIEDETDLEEAGYMDPPKTKEEIEKKYPDTETDVKNKNSRDLQSVKEEDEIENPDDGISDDERKFLKKYGLKRSELKIYRKVEALKNLKK